MAKFSKQTKQRKQKNNDTKNDKKILKKNNSIKKSKYMNKQRVLVFCARGITFRARHLMNDLQTLMPHSKSDSKLDRKDKLFVVNEVCEMKNCNKCVFFEMRRKSDLFMWLSCTPHGPSAKFLVENVHTMDELKLTGNCLKGSRPILSFDKSLDLTPHNILLKEMFTQIFGTPNAHPRSKPFYDHVMCFSINDNRIWFRNYQIIQDGSLLEIGPRFVLNLVRIFEGSFGGATLYENPLYVSPNEHRRMLRLNAGQRYRNKTLAKEALNEKREAIKDIPPDEVEDVFHTITQQEVNMAKNRT
ncbi:ribosome biogenesis protein BRX1 homolog [Dendronephthya gigantea]|uniref:ribosome biogenesis protein BRX1 homolog n=1 Tax=Dendronephthya gigantea TaxID=151771 RepID=UPI00106BCA59|nr:ribosome biogenesis protein BRX1 homolog [Dendronephthya gigantea]XP_028404536.1 ribosome biogenesis protein BRX1 homolog [Dendronephthya gigantea]